MDLASFSRIERYYRMWMNNSYQFDQFFESSSNRFFLKTKCTKVCHIYLFKYLNYLYYLWIAFAIRLYSRGCINPFRLQAKEHDVADKHLEFRKMHGGKHSSGSTWHLSLSIQQFDAQMPRVNSELSFLRARQIVCIKTPVSAIRRNAWLNTIIQTYHWIYTRCTVFDLIWCSVDLYSRKIFYNTAANEKRRGVNIHERECGKHATTVVLNRR